MHRVQEHRFVDLAAGGDRGRPAAGVDRRSFLKAATALAAVTGMSSPSFARNFEPNAEPVRYPDPDVVVMDKRFKSKIGNTVIARIYRGTQWAEGPAWNGGGRYLIWSDIPNNDQLRFIEEDEHVSRRFRSPSNNSNGNTFDYQGRQVACEHLTGRIVRYEHNGEVTVLAESFDGKRLNAPNDVVVHPDDGSIWFTDPGYGALLNYEGKRAKSDTMQPFQKEATYRIDAQSGKLEKVADEAFKPNGVAFSPDYKKFYICDTGITHYENAKNVVWSYDVDGTKLKNPKPFIDTTMDGKSGFADGIRVDEEGNIWAGIGWVGDGYDGVHVFAPDGQRIGLVRLPEICANVCFGGSKRNRLFMASSQSMYALYVETRGAHIT
jgi:gluconolactonase